MVYGKGIANLEKRYYILRNRLIWIDRYRKAQNDDAYRKSNGVI